LLDAPLRSKRVSRYSITRSLPLSVLLCSRYGITRSLPLSILLCPLYEKVILENGTGYLVA
jgi:hypothetical protein